MAHACRKLRDLYANHRSEIAEEGLTNFAAHYEIEHDARELKLDVDDRRLVRQQRSKPNAETLRQWLARKRGLRAGIALYIGDYFRPVYTDRTGPA
jgi:transposase